MQNGLARPGTRVDEAVRLRLPHAVSVSGTEDSEPDRCPSAEATLSPNKLCRACDYGTALWKVGNDVDFFIEMVRRFVVTCPKMLAAMSAHLADEDLQAVESAALALESSLRDLAAKPACAATRRLEMAAREGNPSGVKSALRALQQEMAKLNPELARIGRQLTRREF